VINKIKFSLPFEELANPCLPVLSMHLCLVPKFKFVHLWVSGWFAGCGSVWAERAKDVWAGGA